MKLTFDQNLFVQTTLDSGALTMLGGVTHSLREPGQYRGAVYRGSENIAVFSIECDSNSAIAQANVDLASLDSSVVPAEHSLNAAVDESCGCTKSTMSPPGTPRFVLHPKGYLVFHTSSGRGGYSVLVRKAEEDPKTPIFDSRKLSEGDIFSAAVIRPGQYSVENTLTKASARISVSYPKAEKGGYRPPKPITFECSSRGIEPAEADLKPGQGIHFHFKVPSRIKIELVKADDGPGVSLAPKTLGREPVVAAKKK